MVDTVSPETRSRMMSAIRGKDTKPEVTIRRGLHQRGFRYSLHSKAHPGRPDMTLRKYRAVIWINGCFWHGHGCGAAKLPASRVEYWGPKIDRTRARDAASASAVDAAGWRSITVWECCLRGPHAPSIEKVLDRIEIWLRSGAGSAVLDAGTILESV